MTSRRHLLPAAALAAAFLSVAPPRPAPAAPALSAAEQLHFADGIYLRGFHESAVGEYLALLRDFPDAPEAAAALYRTGECYRQLGNAQGAERFYRRVAAEHPAPPYAPRAELRRATLELDAGRPAEAAARLKALREAPLPLDPDTAAAAAYDLGRAQRDSGDREAAAATWEALLASPPAPDTPYLSCAALDLAELRNGVKKYAARMPAWYALAAEKAATPAAKAEALYRWGEWSFSRGDHASAADTLQSLRMEAPDSRRARDAAILLGWSLYYLDRAPEALDLADAAEASAASAPAAAAAAYLRASALRKLNRDGEALLAYNALLSDYPGTPFAARASYEVMATHFKRGDHAAALAAAPLRPDPEQAADVLWMRAECERALHRADDARADYRALAETHSDSPHAPDALLRLAEMARDDGLDAEAASWYLRAAETSSPDAPAALHSAALSQLRAGDATAALATWDRLLASAADNAKSSPDPDLLASARLQRALALHSMDRTAEAASALDDLLAATPHGPAAAQAHYWRGELQARDENWPAAETSFRAALAEPADPRTASLARLRLVTALQRQDRMDDAADQTEPLLADSSFIAENPALVEWLLKLRFDQGQTTRALRAATELAQNTEDGPWRQIAWYWVGLCRSRTGDDTAAAEAYERAAAIPAQTREGTTALLYLADLDRAAGRYDLALSRFSAAADQARDDDSLDLRVRAYFGLGETEEAAGRPSEAARHYRVVAVLFDDPEYSPHALYRSGLLLKTLGRDAEAADTFAELTARYPESAFARQAAAEQAPSGESAP
ncbi:MAG: tetratricopeptide repeat protein [Kiritimatiellae bacterium]|nr:tetratricopeptide repeat protein [Kiritimatiellia bacterium]